jgi:hypothetical protein
MFSMVTMAVPSHPRRPLPWWLLLSVLLIPCLYLPTLATRFDFADDGVLVYPGPARSASEHLNQIWQHTVEDFHGAGPFRPVTWAHWSLAASLMGPNDFYRRVARFAWSILAAGSLLWLLYELNLRPGAAVLATMLAMWNPYRGEIWMGLGLTEAFAMPYALLGLVCALRAARSRRPFYWDLAGLLCLLSCLLIKNTFAAMVPAQVLLRVMGGGLGLRDGIRQHGRRASAHALLLLLPVTHFIVIKLNPSPTHYKTILTWAQVPRFCSALAGGLSLPLMAPGLLASGLAVWLARHGGGHVVLHASEKRSEYRLPLLTGLVLLVFGTGIYLPFNGVAGRYTMPAVWGADIWLAVLFSMLSQVPLPRWRRLALGLVLAGLGAVAVTNLGRQDKVAARNALLWQALEYVEKEAPKHATLAWLGTPVVGVASPELPISEGVHFRGHLAGRGRGDIDLQLVSNQDQQAGKDSPLLVMTGTPVRTWPGAFRLVREFQTHYWAGQRSFHCYLWEQETQGP